MTQKMKLGALAGILALMALVVISPAMAKKYNSGDKGWIGVYTQSIDDDLREAFDLAADEGVVIVDVVDDSPAEDAGLRPKDVIIDVNGEEVLDGDDLSDIIEDLDIGDEAEIIIIRKGEKKTINVEVGQRPSRSWVDGSTGYSRVAPGVITRNFKWTSGSSGYIGVAIQDLSEQLGDYFGVTDGEGVLISEVFEDSPAEKVGLKAGDVIISVDGEDVAETDELQGIISEKEEGDEITIGYMRRGSKETVKVEVAEDSFGMHGFFIPDIDIQIPDLSGLKHLDHFYFSDDDDKYFDTEEYREEMLKLKQEMKKLSKELSELKKKLE